VMNNLPGVLQRIREELERGAPSIPSPALQGGEGGPRRSRGPGEVGLSASALESPPHPGPLRPRGRRGRKAQFKP
jgi:hypothetical protein